MGVGMDGGGKEEERRLGKSYIPSRNLLPWTRNCPGFDWAILRTRLPLSRH